MVWGWQVDPVNCGQALNKYSIIGLLRQATEKTLSRPEIISSGFKRAGLFPWNTDAPNISKLLPGSVFQSVTLGSTEPSSIAISPKTLGTSSDSSSGEAVSSSPLDVSSSSNIITMESAEVSSIAISSQTSADISPAAAVSSMVVSAASDIISMESPEVSIIAISSQTLDASTTHTSSVGDGSTATLSPDVCVYSAPPEPSSSANSRSLSSIPAMVVSPSPELSSIESPEVSEFVPLDEPTHSTPVDLSNSTYNTEESPADVLNDAMIETHEHENNTPANTFSTPRIMRCPTCFKRIPESVFHIHASYCEPAPSPSDTSTSDIDPVPADESLSSVPVFTLSDRLTMLNKFEVLLLSSEQVSEFNQLFKERKLGMMEPLFQSWLSLKIASVPSEAEAIKLVLSKHTASGVPKRKARRQVKLPVGPARYDPSSPEWKEILVEQDNNKAKKRKSPTVSDACKKLKLARKEEVPVKNAKKAPAKKASEKNPLRL